MERDGIRASAPGDITRLLDAWSQGDSDARDQLMPVVYGELRRRAAAYLTGRGLRTRRRATEGSRIAAGRARKRAFDQFTRALEIQSDYAPAYAGIASYYAILPFQSSTRASRV
jgi:hypothetical protein